MRGRLRWRAGPCAARLWGCRTGMVCSCWNFAGALAAAANSGCWCWARAEGETDVPRLACAPGRASCFFMKTRFHTKALVALSIEYLRFMTASFLHLRASFGGLAKMLPELFPDQQLEPNDCQRVLEQGWFLFETLNRLDSAACIGKSVDIRLASLDATLRGLEPSLSLLLNSQAVAHVCGACANPVLAGDGGMKLTTMLCIDSLQLRIPLGCSQRPCRGSLYCKQHQLSNPPAAPEIHSHRITTQRGLQFRYAGGADYVGVDDVDQRRLRQYDSCNLLTVLGDEVDAAAASSAESGQGGDHGAAPAVLRMHASDMAATDACRCAKDDQKRVAVRKYAGVFVVLLPCGHVVFLRHMVGSESLPQVAYCFAKARELLPSKTFLCYDNACALARYCRNKKRPDSGPLRAAFDACVFFLPCSHVKNHTACLDPESSYYLPEILKEKHEVLTGVNTEVQEQVPCGRSRLQSI